jgi:hypothetical protein
MLYLGMEQVKAAVMTPEFISYMFLYDCKKHSFHENFACMNVYDYSEDLIEKLKMFDLLQQW